MLSEGALTIAFVPMFVKKLENPSQAKAFANECFSLLALVVTFFSALGILIMPTLILLHVSGFQGDERFALAVQYARICFPYILLISLTSLITGLLSALRSFAVAALVPAVLNIILISVLFFSGYVKIDIGLALCWASLFAGILQLAMVWIVASRKGYTLYFRYPHLSPEIRKLLVIAGPALLIGGVSQLNIIVGRQVASFFGPAIGWLYNADRLYQLPLGIVSIAISMVLLPELSRNIQKGKIAKARNTFCRSVEIVLFFTIPASITLVMMSHPIVFVLFERGAFNSNDTIQTASALAVYSLGLPALVLHKTFEPLYFVREDIKQPLNFALFSLLLNAFVAISLMPIFGFIVASIGASVAAWAMLVFLWQGSRTMGNIAKFDHRLLNRLPRILMASISLGVFLYFGQLAIEGMLYTPSIKYVALILLLFSGFCFYISTSILFGAIKYRELSSFKYFRN